MRTLRARRHALARTLALCTLALCTLAGAGLIMIGAVTGAFMAIPLGTIVACLGFVGLVQGLGH
jgi:hypothetical protein